MRAYKLYLPLPSLRTLLSHPPGQLSPLSHGTFPRVASLSRRAVTRCLSAGDGDPLRFTSFWFWGGGRSWQLLGHAAMAWVPLAAKPGTSLKEKVSALRMQ